MSIFAPAFALKRGEGSRGSSKNVFEKKVAKIFGSFENMIYLCTRFSLLTKEGVEARLNWFFDLLVLYIERKV